MNGLLNKTFFRFLFGFMVILGVSLFASGFISFIQDKKEISAASVFGPLLEEVSK